MKTSVLIGRKIKALQDYPNGGDVLKGDIGTIVSDGVVDFSSQKKYYINGFLDYSCYELLPLLQFEIKKELDRFKIGDIIEVIKKPDTWASGRTEWNAEVPLELTFPIKFTVRDIHYESNSNFISLFDGKYGWCYREEYKDLFKLISSVSSDKSTKGLNKSTLTIGEYYTFEWKFDEKDCKAIVYFTDHKFRSNEILFPYTKEYNPKSSAFYGPFEGENRLIRNSTKKEINHLIQCRKAKKYVVYEKSNERWYKRTNIPLEVIGNYLYYVKGTIDCFQIKYYERINSNGSFSYIQNTCVIDNMEELTDLSEIQPYLPDGHVDKQLQFVKGKWYKNIGSGGNYIGKFNRLKNDCFYCSEYIYNNSYRKSEDLNLTASYKNAEVCSLEEIQKYLPDGHVDKKVTKEPYQNVTDINVGDIVKCISENRSRYASNAGAGWRKDLEFKVTRKEKSMAPECYIYFGGKNDNGVYSDAVRLVRRNSLEWKEGAYVRYKGTKNNNGSWERYFGSYGVKAGDVGIIKKLLSDGLIYVKDNIRNEKIDGSLSAEDLELITEEEYNNCLAKLKNKDKKPLFDIGEIVIITNSEKGNNNDKEFYKGRICKISILNYMEQSSYFGDYWYWLEDDKGCLIDKYNAVVGTSLRKATDEELLHSSFNFYIPKVFKVEIAEGINGIVYEPKKNEHIQLKTFSVKKI